eukprot:TRINITY_DN13809_c0_g1_i1.p1 TRINITY_DN13809_c0_g1~~TRINITY_DN13809_c0_g1_i1.p1  ORF type:complete len:354 (+),score=107.80 TRINITY_DN13809_c0_g1_i1:87-1064(+)
MVRTAQHPPAARGTAAARGLLLAGCLSAASAVNCSAGGSAPAALPPQVASWSAAHVGSWIRGALLYPAHAGAFESAGVDGPTLCYLSEAALLELGVDHPVHRKKILARIDLLRPECSCATAAAARRDFWEYAQENPATVLTLLAVGDNSPRVALPWLLARDSAGVAAYLGYPSDGGFGWLQWLVLVALSIVAPWGLIALLALWQFTTNPFPAFAVLLRSVPTQVAEAAVLRELWRQLRREPHKERNWLELLFGDSIQKHLLMWVLYPVPFFVGGLLLPWMLQWIALAAYMVWFTGWGCLVIFSFAAQWIGEAQQDAPKDKADKGA